MTEHQEIAADASAKASNGPSIVTLAEWLGEIGPKAVGYQHQIWDLREARRTDLKNPEVKAEFDRLGLLVKGFWVQVDAAAKMIAILPPRDLTEAVIQVMVAAHLNRRLGLNRIDEEEWKHVLPMLFAGALPMLAQAADVDLERYGAKEFGLTERYFEGFDALRSDGCHD